MGHAAPAQLASLEPYHPVHGGGDRHHAGQLPRDPEMERVSHGTEDGPATTWPGTAGNH